MPEQRNLILAIVLSVTIIIAFQYFYELPRLKEGQRQEAQRTEQMAETAPADEAPRPKRSRRRRPERRPPPRRRARRRWRRPSASPSRMPASRARSR